MLNKGFTLFFVCLGLFAAVALYSAVIYLRWDAPVESNASFEVNLPVIDWQRYSTLSKHPNGVILKKDLL